VQTPGRVAVADAQAHTVEAAEHVEFGQHKLGQAVDADGVAQEHEIEPTAAARAARGRAVLVPGVGARASQALGLGAKGLCGERTLADPGLEDLWVWKTFVTPRMRSM